MIVSRARLVRDLAARDAVIADLREQLADWKGKAERLTDAALARAGAIHQPTMETKKAPDRIAGAAAAISAALSITEIDSSRKRKAS